jgi:hypothetical protein
MTRVCRSVFATVLLMGCFSAAQNASSPASAARSVAGADPDDAQAKLEKDVQNPISELILLPLQNNTNFAEGAYDRTGNVLNIQPVIPINLNSNWMVKSRTILPISWQPYSSRGSGGSFGLGDLSQTFFLSPRHASHLLLGAGPAFLIPTATDVLLGQGKFCIGPSLIAVAQPGRWTFVVIVNNVWSVAGAGSRPPVKQMQLQPIVTRQIQKGWYLTTSPILLADWRTPSGKVWTVPLGGGLGRVTKMGGQPINVTAQFYGNAAYPTGGSPWSMRLQFDFLFPKGTQR